MTRDAEALVMVETVRDIMRAHVLTYAARLAELVPEEAGLIDAARTTLESVVDHMAELAAHTLEVRPV